MAIHICTGKLHVYARLAMCPASSPAEAGKGRKYFDNTVLEDLGRDFRGTINHSLNLAIEQLYQPELWMGLAYQNKDDV